MAIELGQCNAMNSLATYYYVEKDYTMAKKYYLMAIDLNHSKSMNDLGIYYKRIEKNDVLSTKYLNMSRLKSANVKDECCVCLEENTMYYTGCKIHYICRECCIKLLHEPCPLCRQ
jgi:TPR repeat protein